MSVSSERKILLKKELSGTFNKAFRKELDDLGVSRKAQRGISDILMGAAFREADGFGSRALRSKFNQGMEIVRTAIDRETSGREALGQFLLARALNARRGQSGL